MRSVWVLVLLGCGSSAEPEERTPSTPSTSPTAATSHMTSSPEMGTTPPARSETSEMAPETTSSTPAPGVPDVAEPTEVPEPLRASHDRLAARIEANANDVASICALASVLRRAQMYGAAGAQLDDAFRIAGDMTLDVDLAPGTLEACSYERGRVAEAEQDWPAARESYWLAMTTPNERRRQIASEAFFRVAKSELEVSCDSMSKIGLRALVSLKDDPVFRRCLRQREQLEPTCEILRLDDHRHPGTRADNFDEYATVGEDGAAFGIIDDELHVISVIRGRKQVRLCDFDLPDDSRFGYPRILGLGDTTLFYVSTTSVTSYTCECEDGEEGYPGSPGDCRCEDAFDIRYVFTDRGELRLALIGDYSTLDGMVGVTWDASHIRASIPGPSVDGETLILGRRLRLRSHVLVPAE
ncbi:MAG: hypothetical protein AB8H86_15740 [Polyangiales bacterium]